MSISEIVRGTTSVPAKNHYVIIIPETTPDDFWVQRRPATVSGGTWTGRGQFGEGSVGIGDAFLIRCFATSATLPAGKLDMSALPADLVMSPPVKVKRVR